MNEETKEIFLACFFVWVVAITGLQIFSSIELEEKIDTIKLQDQCELIHGMKTVKARKFNPKHNRELKRVVLTCGEG